MNQSTTITTGSLAEHLSQWKISNYDPHYVNNFIDGATDDEFTQDSYESALKRASCQTSETAQERKETSE